MMVQLLRYIAYTFLSFIIFFEILSYPKVKNNFLRPEATKINNQQIDIGPKAFLIGDSYAHTGYLKDGFPQKFKRHFDKKGYHFQNLSDYALEFNEHLSQFQNLKTIHPEIIIYFYNINDIVSLDNQLFGGIDQNQIRVQSENQQPIQNYNPIDWIRMYSSSFVLLKDILHLTFRTSTGRPIPGSTIYKLPQSHVKYRSILEDYFSEFATYTDQLLIVVNTPMNYGSMPQKWEHYRVLNEMTLPENTTIIHAVDIIGDSKNAISWRNGHYNQKGVDKLHEHLEKMLDH